MQILLSCFRVKTDAACRATSQISLSQLAGQDSLLAMRTTHVKMLYGIMFYEAVCILAFM